jgi:hypothetical protein
MWTKILLAIAVATKNVPSKRGPEIPRAMRLKNPRDSHQRMFQNLQMLSFADKTGGVCTARADAAIPATAGLFVRILHPLIAFHCHCL